MHIPANKADSSGNGQAPAAAEKAVSAASREFHDFVADIEDLVSATTSLTGEELARARAKVAARIAAARDSIQDMGAAVAQRTRNGARAADGYVHEQPWTAIGIGAAAGVLLGFVLARRA